MTKNSKRPHPSRSGPRQPNPEGYTVGPGYPPFPTRFEEGQPSPNPSGRPPKKKQEALIKSFDTFQNLVVEHGEIKMPILRNGENIELTHLQAFLDILFKQAAKGNAKAMGLYMMAQREAAEAQRVFREGILLAANQHIDRWLHLFLVNESEGKPMPAGIYPDPRDIIINSDGSVDIVGPVDLQQQLLVDELMALRDEYLEGWDKVLSAGVPQNNFKNTWRQCNKNIEKWNSAIPPRLRKSLPGLEKYLVG